MSCRLRSSLSTTRIFFGIAALVGALSHQSYSMFHSLVKSSRFPLRKQKIWGQMELWSGAKTNPPSCRCGESIVDNHDWPVRESLHHRSYLRRQAQQGGIPWRPLLHLWQSFSSWLLFFTLHDGALTDNGSKKQPWCLA